MDSSQSSKTSAKTLQKLGWEIQIWNNIIFYHISRKLKILTQGRRSTTMTSMMRRRKNFLVSTSQKSSSSQRSRREIVRSWGRFASVKHLFWEMFISLQVGEHHHCPRCIKAIFQDQIWGEVSKKRHPLEIPQRLPSIQTLVRVNKLALSLQLGLVVVQQGAERWQILRE